MYFILQVL